MQFTLTINMDNEAFQNRPLGELAECLNSVVERLCLSGNQPVEAVAEVVYDTMMFNSGRLDCRPAPPWVHGGNSLAQDEARDAARKILAMVPPAPGVTLTDVDSGRIKDTNGNTVGNWTIEKT